MIEIKSKSKSIFHSETNNERAWKQHFPWQSIFVFFSFSFPHSKMICMFFQMPSSIIANSIDAAKYGGKQYSSPLNSRNTLHRLNKFEKRKKIILKIFFYQILLERVHCLGWLNNGNAVCISLFSFNCQRFLLLFFFSVFPVRHSLSSDLSCKLTTAKNRSTYS